MQPSETPVKNPPERQLVAFDGDCGFCRFWVTRWQALTPGLFDWEPYQSLIERFPEIPESAFAEAVQLILPDGRVISGADAVLKVLSAAPGWRTAAKVISHIPVALSAVRLMYRFIAKHRSVFSLLTRLAWGHHAQPPTFFVSRRLFAISLGTIFFVAFASLFVQVLGLYGSQGVSPIADTVNAARQQIGDEAIWYAPSIFWLGTGDTTLRVVCLAGMGSAAALILGFSPGICALFCWILYLSFCSLGTPFLDFQWDALLLETALLATIYLPWALRPQWERVGFLSKLGRLLIAWLLFRLMLESGAVKLASGDPTWRNLTALDYHFETQPLPLWTAWFAHHGSIWIHRISTLGTFAIEFAAPFALFAPRNFRHLAAWSIIALQVGILLTGNYAFFNWLTIALCLPLFDDTLWPKSWRQRVFNFPIEDRLAPSKRVAGWVRYTAITATVPLLLLTGWQAVSSFDRSVPWPQWLVSLRQAVAPYRSFNSYGLFAVMTTRRPEIIVEGSNDARVWHAYEFRWKPGDLRERPKLVAPHQPRLDWQMWFAALGDVRGNPWFIGFMLRLLEGSPDVLNLLDWNPFPKEPPKYVRAVVYDYGFSEPGSGSAWWRREPRGIYVPPISLEQFSSER